MFADGISIWVFLPLVLLAYYGVSMLGRLNKKEAAKLLSEGAVLVDVRSTEEFNSHRVEGSINIPLQTLSAGAQKHLQDKKGKKVALCFCLSGARSSSAVGQLKRMGYTAYNIGTVSRAQSIVSLSAADDR